MIKIGLIKLFSNPKTTATNMAVAVLLMVTPLKIKEAIKTATEVMSVLDKNFIMPIYLNHYKFVKLFGI